MKVTFFSGVGSVTGANFLLETGSSRILVDCGLIQGEREAMKENSESFGYEPSSIDMLFVTHAHLDHVGRIPKLVKEGFKGEIYSTPETRALAELILEDAAGLMAKFAKEDGILPIYEMNDVKNSMLLWKTIPYHAETQFGDFSLYIKDAGHILGSGMFQFTAGGKKIVFTGDLGNSPTPLLMDTEPIEGADYLIMESVYGDRNHESKDIRKEKLEKIIKDTISKGGTLVIPAFSLERTQVIIYEINKLVESKVIPTIPVFIDSPLAIKVTEVYRASTGLFNGRAQEEIRNGDDIFNFPKLSYTVSREDSEEIDRMNGPKIIIAGSGMSVGGRVRHHEGMYLPDPSSTILLVGYQTLGTTGRHLLEGAKKVNIGGKQIEVRAKIESILGYSSHKDSDHMVELVSTAQNTVKKVFVVMGEPKAATFLAQRINNELGVQAICPEKGMEYEL
ncbi:MAG: MBL fold metallo-hydrolase [bacterium]|nr:MBL fold metallo-hydrolase [bacterium]